MKRVWLEVKPWDKDAITTAIETGVDAVYVEKDDVKKVKELGLINVIADSKEADLKMGKDVLEIEIKSKDDENKVASLTKEIAIVEANDWTIIPLENLIAQDAKVIFPVTSLEDAKLALTIMEKGVWGIIIRNNDPLVIKAITEYAKGMSSGFNLKEFVIKEVVKVSMGDRVCIDTITDMNVGQGMLIGNYSNAFFLVHSESIDNPYVNARPFRVNAGGIHAYIIMPDGKTKYLDELRTGEEILIVDEKGKSMLSTIGRLKIEKRPMLNIIAEVEGKDVSLILQNAETIRLTDIKGKPISVVKLKKGDKVLGYTEQGGRHFGYKVEESINER